MTRLELSDMTASLRHLLADEDSSSDFVLPTLLREVPSLTLPHSNYKWAMSEYAELGGRSYRNS